jgi:hypothetical protein
MAQVSLCALYFLLAMVFEGELCFFDLLRRPARPPMGAALGAMPDSTFFLDRTQRSVQFVSLT